MKKLLLILLCLPLIGIFLTTGKVTYLNEEDGTVIETFRFRSQDKKKTPNSEMDKIKEVKILRILAAPFYITVNHSDYFFDVPFRGGERSYRKNFATRFTYGVDNLVFGIPALLGQERSQANLRRNHGTYPNLRQYYWGEVPWFQSVGMVFADLGAYMIVLGIIIWTIIKEGRRAK